jgi:L-asparaginase
MATTAARYHRRARFSIACALIVPLAAASTPITLEAQEKLPLVVVVATGGTIANTRSGRLPVETVLKAIPDVGTVARIEVVDYSRVGGHELTIKNELDIARIATEQLARPEVAGVVVTHGSNTSDETAYFLSLLVRSDKALVLVAAQRTRDSLSEDGSRNLLDAVRVAANPATRGFGAMVVVNQVIHPAREVKKTLGSGRVDTWESGRDTGPIGVVDGNRVVFYNRPLTRHTTRSEFNIAALRPETMPAVDIVYSYVDADGFIIDALVKQKGVKGIVIASFMTGTAAPRQAEALERAAKAGVVVVSSTRGWGGRVSGNAMRLGADNLSPEKARILLMLGLTVTNEPDELQRMLNEY